MSLNQSVVISCKSVKREPPGEKKIRFCYIFSCRYLICLFSFYDAVKDVMNTEIIIKKKKRFKIHRNSKFLHKGICLVEKIRMEINAILALFQ